MAWSKWVDLKLPKPTDGMSMPFDTAPPVADQYPYGMRITLEERVLDAAGLDCDCDIGDVIDLRGFASVVRVEKEAGRRCVTLQLEKIRIEDEDKEDE